MKMYNILPQKCSNRVDNLTISCDKEEQQYLRSFIILKRRKSINVKKVPNHACWNNSFLHE